MADLKGIDVSHHQNDEGSIDWSAVKSADYSFAFIKLTEGQTFKDPFGMKNVTDAKTHGLLVGGYHFARFLNVDDARKEADFFRSITENLELDYVILDIEHREASGDLTEAALVFLDKVADLGVAVFYSYPSYIEGHFNKGIVKYPLWIAHYGVDKPDVQFWGDWSVWQQSSGARVPGINGSCDVNVMKPAFVVHKVSHETQTKSEVIKARGTYSIQSGDTFWGLEEIHNWKHGTLTVLNPNVNARKLKVGQKINVPEDIGNHSAAKYHTVEKGESLSVIAAHNEISLAEIEKLNPQLKGHFDIIQSGEKVRIK